MLKCSNCGKQDPSSLFCADCGGLMVELSPVPPHTPAGRKSPKFFADPTEYFVASLGDEFMKRHLAGDNSPRGFAALSNRRVYFKGARLTSSGSRFISTQNASTVDIKDIISSDYKKLLQPQILLLLTLPFFIVFVNDNALREYWPAFPVYFAAIFVIFLFLRRTVFEVKFIGGSDAFDTKWYNRDEIEDFRRHLHNAVIRTANESKTPKPKGKSPPSGTL